MKKCFYKGGKFMKKTLLFGVAALSLAMAACGNNSSSEPVELTQTDVANLLNGLASQFVNGYTSLSRNYMDSYLDGTIFTNRLEKTTLRIHENGFDADASICEPTTVPTSLEYESSVEGRYAAYILDDDYYIRGFLSNGSDHSADYYEYNENNLYTDLPSLALSSFTGMLSDTTRAFSAPEELWPSSYNFTVNEFVSEISEDNNIICSISAFAPEDDYYAYEEGKATITISGDGKTILGMDFTVIVYDFGFSTDPELHAATYNYYSVTDIEYGNLLTSAVEPFDVNDFSADGIVNAPHQIVENIPSGQIEADVVQEIMANYKAYNEGIVSSSTTGYALENYDSSWNDVGPAVITQEATRYLDNIMIVETSYDYDDETIADSLIYSQHVAGEDGIEIMEKNGTELTGILNNKEYIASLNDYLNPSPLYRDMTLPSALSFIGSNGFGSFEDSYSTTDVALVSAVKEGTNITIKMTYDVTSVFYTLDYDLEIVIVDDFMTTINMDSDDGTYSHYSMVKGNLTQFDGELIPFEPTLY